MSTGHLKKYPDSVIKLVHLYGVSFLPTRTDLRLLVRDGVHPDVVPVIQQMAASRMRIKVCIFSPESPGEADVAGRFAQAMRRSVIIAKQSTIPGLGYIPLDDAIGPISGFDKQIIPLPDTMYFLLEGWIYKGTNGSYRLEPLVIYRDAKGEQHPLPGASNPPKEFTDSTSTRQEAADAVVRWSIETAKQYINQ
jgi:hypothetical protein